MLLSTKEQLINIILIYHALNPANVEIHFQLSRWLHWLMKLKSTPVKISDRRNELRVTSPQEKSFYGLQPFVTGLLDEYYLIFCRMPLRIPGSGEGCITIWNVCGERLKQLFVSDTGCGIPKEKLPWYLHRFEKLNDFGKVQVGVIYLSESCRECLGRKINVESK